MARCGDLVPRFSGSMVHMHLDEHEIGECLLREGHEGEHLVKTRYGYDLWQPQELPCLDSKGEVCSCDYIECYYYETISEEMAQQILAKDGAGTD